MRQLILISALPLLLTACGDSSTAMAVPGGDPALGAPAIETYGCGTCHRIPNVPGANGTSGPPLTAMSKQAYIAGVVPNRPEEFVRFIMNPQEIDPLSAMPDLSISEEEARNIAAFLYQARGDR